MGLARGFIRSVDAQEAWQPNGKMRSILTLEGVLFASSFGALRAVYAGQTNPYCAGTLTFHQLTERCVCYWFEGYAEVWNPFRTDLRSIL